MLCPVMLCYDNRGDRPRGDCDEKEKQNNWGDQHEWGDEITDKTRVTEVTVMKEIPRMTGMIRMTRMYDWDDYRTELNKMAGTNGMTEMTGITTMTTVYRDWDDQDEQVDWDKPMCSHTLTPPNKGVLEARLG